MKTTLQASLFGSMVLLSPLSRASPVARDHTLQEPVIILSSGEGLPSLSELGLTVHDLIDPNFAAKPATDHHHHRPLEGRDAAGQGFFPHCYKANTASLGGAMTCKNYLNSLNQDCMVTNQKPWEYLCNVTVNNNPTYIRGQPLSGVDEVRIPCSDVAKGMDWILDLCSPQGCTGNDCPVGGVNAAWRNGNFVLEIIGNPAILKSD